MSGVGNSTKRNLANDSPICAALRQSLDINSNTTGRQTQRVSSTTGTTQRGRNSSVKSRSQKSLQLTKHVSQASSLTRTQSNIGIGVGGLSKTDINGSQTARTGFTKQAQEIIQMYNKQAGITAGGGFKIPTHHRQSMHQLSTIEHLPKPLTSRNTIEGSKQMTAISMNIDENALAKSILAGKLDLLRIFMKVKQNWATWVCSFQNQSEHIGQGIDKIPLLHLAILSNSMQVVEFIINRGLLTGTLDINLKNQYSENKETALSLAVKRNSCELVTLLLSSGCLPNIPENGTKFTPLHFAVGTDCPQCVFTLIQFGANMKSRDSQGLVPLHSAIIAGSVKSVQLLIQKGADPMEIWTKKYRPLHLAAQSDNFEILSYLLITLIENCSNFLLNELTEDGRDPLDLALEQSQTSPSSIDSIKLLLESGHPVSARHIDRARESENPIVYNLLTKHRQAAGGPPVSYITRDSLLIQPPKASGTSQQKQAEDEANMFTLSSNLPLPSPQVVHTQKRFESHTCVGDTANVREQIRQLDVDNNKLIGERNEGLYGDIQFNLMNNKAGQKVVKITIPKEQGQSEPTVIFVNIKKLIESKLKIDNKQTTIKRSQSQIGFSKQSQSSSPFITSEPLQLNHQLTKLTLRPEMIKLNKERRLGSGTYSTVYEGSYLGTTVAIKRFRKADNQNLKAWGTELDVMHWLQQNGSHQGVVHMYGSYQDKKYGYIVLEKADHGNAYEYIRRNKGKIPLKSKLKWALQISQGIAFLHNHVQGEMILHRDIKAENMLIMNREDSIVKLCDFGQVF